MAVAALVDTDDKGRYVGALRQSSDDNLLGAGLDVLPGARAVNEDSGTLHDTVQHCQFSCVGD